MVSAQKRTENLQNVPLSIQALGNEKIEELHLQSFGDYANFLPSLSYQNGGQSPAGPGFSRAYMRGVASGDTGNHSGSSPSVGTYLDEQPVTTISGALDIHLYDIARVEALAGPQGTLYGASSQAGTIRIITNKPDPSGFAAGYDLQGSALDHGGNGYTAEGFMNMPLSPNAALRVVGWYEKIPGFIDNVHGTVFYPTSGVTKDNSDRVEKDYNDGTTYGARAAMKVDLNDSWTITPSVIAQRSKFNGSSGYRVGEDFDVVRFNPESINDRWWQAALTVEGKFSNFDVVYAGAVIDRRDETRQDYVDYSFYYDQCCAYGTYIFDNAGNFIDPTQYIAGKDRYKMQSHELRVSTPQDRRVRLVAGLFYERNQHDILQNYLINNLADSVAVTGWPDTWWLTNQVRVDRDSAAFGELTYDLTEKLSATGGIRFFKSEGSLEGFFGFGLNNDFTSATGEKNPLCAAHPQNFNGAPCQNLDKSVDESGNSAKLNLTYRFSGDALGYLTYSEGFRPGGVNRVGDLPPYDADFLKNYEAGWKTSWLDNRVRFNGAVFVEDWKDFQFSFLGPNSVTQIANAGNAQIKGVETEINWAPTDSFTLSAGAAYLDAKLTQAYCGELGPDGKDLDPCPQTPLAPNGQQLPVTPKFKGNLVGRYTFNLGTWDAHFQGAVAHLGSRWPDLRTEQRAVLGRVPSFTITNLAAGIDNDTYSVELFVNNIFDEKGQVDRWAQCDALVCGVEGTYITPTAARTMGIKFAQKF